MSRDDVDALRRRLADAGVSVSTVMTNSFGARGLAPEAVYFRDPDNNVIEARFYG
jgi:glyoxylase I family protein